MSRAEAKRAFLRAAGWGGAEAAPLAGDASNRRYDRVARGPGGAGAVLMDAPAERGEDISIFLAFTGLLRDLGYSAPEVYAADIPGGWALIEDLGDDLYARLCAAAPGIEAEIYGAAVDLLRDLHRAPPPAFAEGSGARVPVPPYDEAVLVREAALALDWWRLGVAGAAPGAALSENYAALIVAVCAGPAKDRRALVLRDYHAENLLWLPERAGLARVGLLDYQDALAGAPAYDLVSLLEDARRDTSAELRAAMVARYTQGMDAEDRAAFAADYAALGAQRNLKIVGIFARLWLRDGKPAYLDLIPRVWRHLTRDLAHPALAPLADFVAAHVPPPTPDNIARVRAGRS